MMTNIGIIYKEQNEFSKALDIYFKALSISESLNNKNTSARLLGNIGTLYIDKKEFRKSLEYFAKALKLEEETGNKDGMATDLGNSGLAYQDLKEYDKAFEQFKKALELHTESGNKSGIARLTGNIGGLYLTKKDYKNAEPYLLKALAISDSIGFLDLRRQFEDDVYDLYEKTNRPALALQHYKKYIQVRDSIFSEENKNKSIRTEMEFEFQKKEGIARAEQDKKDALAEKEKKVNQFILGITVAGLVVMIVFALIVYRSYSQKKKANLIISQQKEEILDSIRYARRIQDSFLPTNKYVEKTFKRLNNEK